MNDDDASWWQSLNSEAEQWEWEYQQRKQIQSGLPITPDTNKQKTQEKPK